MKHTFSKISIAASLLLLLPGCTRNDSASGGGGSSTPPNVLILFTDDQRYDTVHSLGNAQVSTPNIDELVGAGTAFTRAHIMGGMHGALCAPSRAMLMTGRSLFSLEGSGDVIPPEHVMMPQAFADHGYVTFGTGKWHNDRPAYARAFQNGDNIFFGGMHWPADGGHEAPQLHHFDSTGVYANDDRWQAAAFSSTMFANAAIEFIRSQRGGDSPFFAYVAFSSPHDPRTPPPPYDAAYDAQSVPLPAAFMPEHPFDNGELMVRDERLLPHPRTKDAVRGELAAYYGMISEVDAQIGRILDALEETGVRENTIIVYAGDNGLAVGNHGLLGKQNLYDHSMRVPMVLAGPGVPVGQRRSALVYQYDVFPTLAALAGLELPGTVEGKNLVNSLRDPEAVVRESAFYAYRNLQRGLRTLDDWKIIRYNVNGVDRVQLFDLSTDPNELHNLAEESAHAGRLRRLDSLLTAQSRAFHDRVDLSAPNWGKPAS